MSAGSKRLSAYLERIGLAGPPPANPTGLEALQRAHRLAITFENLDIHLGRPILVDSDSVFDKLVTRGRGGYCFEQNRLFADMLRELGLPSRPLLARSRLSGVSLENTPRTHTLLLAIIGGDPWILDAGFGGSYVPVLPLADGASALTPDGAAHRLRRIGALGSLTGEWLLERAGPFAATDGRRLASEDWQPQYSFDLAEVAPADLSQANHWTATAPISRFTQLHIATLALPYGFASLVNQVLHIYDGASRSEIEAADLAHYQRLVAEHLRLPLEPGDAASLPLFA